MKTIPVDWFAQFRMIAALRANTKDATAFLLKQANIEENRYDANLWLYRGNEMFPLTASGDIAHFWWRGDSALVFTKKQDEKKLYQIRIDRPGEACVYKELPQEVEDLLFLDKERFLYIGKREKQEQEDYEIITELPIWQNGEGFTSGKRNGLFMWDGQESKPLTDEKTDVACLRLSADAGKAYYFSCRFDTVAPVDNRLVQLDLQTLQTTDISVAPVFAHSSYAVLPDGALLVAGSDMQKYGINQNASFYKIDGTKKEPLYEGGMYSDYNSVGTDLLMSDAARWQVSGEKMYWIATIEDSSHLMSMDTRNGAIEQLTREKGSVMELALQGDRLLFTAMRGLNGVELYALTDKKEKRLSSFNQNLADGCFISVPEELNFINEEKTTIHGFIMKPIHWQAEKKYPVILYIHGGPKTVYGTVLFHEMQYLTSLGYGVIFCNPTGSDGRGDAFADLRARYGQIDYRDIMKFTQTALAQNTWIDAKKLGVAGGSYGGFMTNWIIGHTNLFAAAVSQRSISNWVTMANTSDIGYYFEPDQAGTDSWTDQNALWDSSPLKYADKVSTPTLFIHSEEDYRCWMVEAVQMYTALQLHGVDTRLCLFRGENHELSRSGKPRHRIGRLREIASWFHTYLS